MFSVFMLILGDYGKTEGVGLVGWASALGGV